MYFIMLYMKFLPGYSGLNVLNVAYFIQSGASREPMAIPFIYEYLTI